LSVDQQPCTKLGGTASPATTRAVPRNRVLAEEAGDICGQGTLLGQRNCGTARLQTWTALLGTTLAGKGLSTEQEASATARDGTHPQTACDNTSSSAREAHAQGDERHLRSRRAPRPAELRNNTSANLDRAARNNAGNKGLHHGTRDLSNCAGQHPSGSDLAVREHTRSLRTRFRRRAATPKMRASNRRRGVAGEPLPPRAVSQNRLSSPDAKTPRPFL
jgi:hypothetical protein